MDSKSSNFECRRDHLVIRGSIFGDTANPKPVVILSHGFLANRKMCAKYAKLLADIGYIAVTFDFCGGGLFSKSDGKSIDMTIDSELSDLFSVVEYIKNQPYTENISLLGCSQGGFVSAIAAKKVPEQFEKLILMYPALCIPDDARRGKMLFCRFDPENIPDVIGRFPMSIGGDYARTVIDKDPYEMIGGYSRPVLYLHGTKDRVVNISYARKAKDLYPNCEYHEIEGAGHLFRGNGDRQACELLKRFMEHR